jgi:hypothetical protein
MDPIFWRSVLADGAQRLGQRLQEGTVDRRQRAATRALLVRAFDALDANNFTAELARQVDRAVTPQAIIPRAVRLLGPEPFGVVDGDFLERLSSPERQVDELMGRLNRFLASMKREEVRRFLQTPKEGEGSIIEYEYTEG